MIYNNIHTVQIYARVLAKDSMQSYSANFALSWDSYQVVINWCSAILHRA